MRPDRQALIGHHPFPLDEFQLRALDALDAGTSVLVAAPTGSGKTVVAEYAVATALADGRRAFYTAPIKALSNQKFQDLGRIHGRDRVGLLTGDRSINADAAVVVMTTEVLRNMIYARSAALHDLGCVVLDEVHFIQDAYRGPVWEEVIIHLPSHVRLVCLSATVSNAEEVADWITTVRGPTAAIIEHTRPVPLEHLFMVGDKTSDRQHLLPTLVGSRPNPEALRLEEQSLRGWRSRRGHHPRRVLYTPSRLDVIERLAAEGMLPTIYFIFSRSACEEAARSVLDAGIRLTSTAEQERIREIVEARLGEMEPRDLDVLGYPQFVAQLEAGVAAHHAGMVPPFKEAVEACFVEGLVKAVFATETLAVGINMPARSVVIEKLTKFTGDHHEFLTPGEYTQLTGRAGRRGIDERGYAIVLWSPFVPFEQVAGLAASRAFRLTSAFRPTYNMAANLVSSYSSDEAHHLLNLSFAQYQADREVVRLEARLERRRAQLAELQLASEGRHRDLHEHPLQPAAARPEPPSTVIESSLARLRPGDVIHVEKGRVSGRAAVLSVAQRKRGTKITVLTTRRSTLNLSAPDFIEAPEVLASIELPSPYAPNRPEFQRQVAERLGRAKLSPRPPRSAPSGADQAVEDDQVVTQRHRVVARLAAEIDALRTKVQGRTSSIARSFDQVLRILSDWGYVDGWNLTDAGRVLARTFHESDLLVAECVVQGVLDGLEPAHLAGLVSAFVYEHRSPTPLAPPLFPTPEVRRRFQRIVAISRELQRIEQEAGLPPHRAPDPSFVAIACAWATGEGFAEVVEAEELSGGDFVRTVKQLIDLLRQLSHVAPNPNTRRAAEQAAEQLFRGVVAASSAVADDDDHAG